MGWNGGLQRYATRLSLSLWPESSLVQSQSRLGKVSLVPYRCMSSSLPMESMSLKLSTRESPRMEIRTTKQ